jgi:hypothetical protein
LKIRTPPRESTKATRTGYGQVAGTTPKNEHVPAPDGWTKTFTDPRLCAAIVDRLTFGGNIIETGSDSYRLAHTRTQQAHTTR